MVYAQSQLEKQLWDMRWAAPARRRHPHAGVGLLYRRRLDGTGEPATATARQRRKGGAIKQSALWKRSAKGQLWQSKTARWEHVGEMQMSKKHWTNRSVVVSESSTFIAVLPPPSLKQPSVVLPATTTDRCAATAVAADNQSKGGMTTTIPPPTPTPTTRTRTRTRTTVNQSINQWCTRSRRAHSDCKWTCLL